MFSKKSNTPEYIYNDILTTGSADNVKIEIYTYNPDILGPDSKIKRTMWPHTNIIQRKSYELKYPVTSIKNCASIYHDQLTDAISLIEKLTETRTKCLIFLDTTKRDLIYLKAELDNLDCYND